MSRPVVSEESSLASKCMEFSQALASQEKAFSFSIKIGDTFSFSLDTKEKALAPQARKVSPSTQKRNNLRRQRFVASKTKLQDEALKEPANISVPVKCPVTCDICGHTTKTENGMKLHRKNKHELSQIDRNTSVMQPEPEEDTVQKHSAGSNDKEEDPLVLEMQDNGLARIKLITDGTPPPKVLHAKLGVGTNPRQSKLKDKNCIEYVFEKGKFAIEVFPN